MTILKRVWVAPNVEKDGVETQLMWLKMVQKLRHVDHMKDSQITRGRRKSRKTIR